MHHPYPSILLMIFALAMPPALLNQAVPTNVAARQVGLTDLIGSLTVGTHTDLDIETGAPLAPRVTPSKAYAEDDLIHRSGDVR